MRRDVGLGELVVWIPPFGEAFEPANQEAASFLNQPGMPDRDRRGCGPGDRDNRHCHTKYDETSVSVVVHTGEHVV